MISKIDREKGASSEEQSIYSVASSEGLRPFIASSKETCTRILTPGLTPWTHSDVTAGAAPPFLSWRCNVSCRLTGRRTPGSTPRLPHQATTGGSDKFSADQITFHPIAPIHRLYGVGVQMACLGPMSVGKASIKAASHRLPQGHLIRSSPPFCACPFGSLSSCFLVLLLLSFSPCVSKTLAA